MCPAPAFNLACPETCICSSLLAYVWPRAGRGGGGLWNAAAESLAQTLVKPLMKQMPETEAPRKERDLARAAELLGGRTGLGPYSSQ